MNESVCSLESVYYALIMLRLRRGSLKRMSFGGDANTDRDLKHTLALLGAPEWTEQKWEEGQKLNTKYNEGASPLNRSPV